MNQGWEQLKHQIKTAPATFGLIFLNTIAVIVTGIRGGFTLSTLLDLGGLVPVLVQEGDIWRILTSMFLHGGILHYAMNMMALYYLGGPLERIMGSFKFALLYLLAGIGSGVAVTWMEDPFTLTIGASGSVYGLMAALFYITFMKKTWFSPSSVKSIRTMIVVNFSITFLFPSISIWGHLGGFAAGFLLCLVLIPKIPHFLKNRRSWDPGTEENGALEDEVDPLA